MRDASVDLWATDEVHFQQHGSRCQMWIPPETKDPILLHHPTRRSVGYFGAVRLRDEVCFQSGDRPIQRHDFLGFHAKAAAEQHQKPPPRGRHQ
jgi:hypothetical protein